MYSSLQRYTYKWIYVYVYIYGYMYIHTHTFRNRHTCVHICVCVYVTHTHTFRDRDISVYIYVGMYMSIVSIQEKGKFLFGKNEIHWKDLNDKNCHKYFRNSDYAAVMKEYQSIGLNGLFSYFSVRIDQKERFILWQLLFLLNILKQELFYASK